MEFKSRSQFKNDPRVIRLKDGQSVIGVLRGDPIEFESSFKGGPAKFRFKVEIVIMNGSTAPDTASVLEGGWKLYRQLIELQDAGWSLEKSFVKVSRVGSGINDTAYSATCLPTPPSSGALAQIARVPRIDLEGSTPGSNPRNASLGQPEALEGDFNFDDAP